MEDIVHLIRKDFPILDLSVNGNKLVYFDNAATTQKPITVLNTITDCYLTKNSNVHRGVHFLSDTMTRAFESSRDTIRNFINASSNEEIIFTNGTTSAINLVAFSFGETYIREGDEIIISEMEHHSNIVPWQMLCERKKSKLKILNFNDDGNLDINTLESLINNKTKLICVTHISNVLGTINPISNIINIAHKNNIPVLIDGAQSIQHAHIDVQQLDCDFFVFSGHKMYGPTGIGVLYGKKQYLENMQAYQGGGEMISSVSFAETKYNVLPYKFEAGTPNYIGATALSSAIEYINNIGINNIKQYEKLLLDYTIEKLNKINNIIIYGDIANKSSLVSFNIKNIHNNDIGILLDKLGIAIRTGSHCAEPIMQHYNILGTARASFAFYNTFEEIDIFIKSLERAIKIIAKS